MITPTHIFVHHTAVPYKKNPDQWPATERYHIGKGWGTGGYNAEVSAAGSIHTFRKDGTPTAAQYVAKKNDLFASNVNLNSGMALSICMDGNFDIEEPTDEQCVATLNWIKERMLKYGIPAENVHMHRAVSPKSCAGSKLPDDIFSYLEKRCATIPDWAEEAVEVAKKLGIKDWDHPWEELTAPTVEYIMNDLGFRDKVNGKYSKLEFIVSLYKAGLLK